MSKVIQALPLAALVVMATVSGAHAVGTPAGTDITNTATVDYEDGNGNPLMSTSNTVTTTVSQVAAIQFVPDNAATGTPGDTLYYAHTITNLGNATDVFDFSASSTQGWTVQYYRDVNGDQAFDPGDTPLADTNANSSADTDSIAADDSLRILVCVLVPVATPDGTVDVTTVTATSAFDNGVTDDVVDTTTIESPVLSVLKSVAPVGDQPPGTELTYTLVVTNNGTADANNVILTDNVPTFTTYVGTSILQDGLPRTDIGGDDNADHNVTTAGAVTVNVGSLSAGGGTTTIEFRVTID